jgi:hypothetical protein
MLPIKKIYVDSRYKSADSASDSDFYIDLPINLLMPANTGFYIDDVAIPVSWYSVTAGRHDKLWFKVNYVTYTVTIPQGDYSLVMFNQALVDKMNSLFPDHFVAAPIVRENKVSIVGLTTTVFQIMSDLEVKEANGDTNTTVNKFLGNKLTGYRDHNNPYVSSYINLFPIRNLYLTCSGLGNFNTMSVNGDRSSIKKNPVNAGYGEMIFDQSVVGIDYLDCSHQTLSRLGFQLKDVFGNIVDLQQNHFSLSIVFSRIQDIQ